LLPPFKFEPLEAFDPQCEPRPAGVLVYASLCLSSGKLYFGVTTQTFRRRAKKHISFAARGSGYLFHKTIRRWTLSPEQLEDDKSKMRNRERSRRSKASSANPLVATPS
jgi:predicted GIY-YIG superfamily endonuclease